MDTLLFFSQKDKSMKEGDGMNANGIASLICIGLLGGDIITGASAGKVVFHALLFFINSVLWLGWLGGDI